MNRCPNCFQPWDGDECAYCAYKGEASKIRDALPQGTLLCAEQYELGLALVSSRQSIAYAAFDREMDDLVLITEFYPKEVAKRAADGRLIQARRNQALFSDACEEYLTSRQLQALPLIASFRGNGTVYRVHEATINQTLPQNQADQLLDTPILFRDNHGRPRMTINALPIPAMPDQRNYRPMALVASHKRKHKIVKGLCVAAIIGSVGIGAFVGVQAMKRSQVTIRLETFGQPIRARLQQGEEDVKGEMQMQGSEAVYVFAVPNGKYVFEVFGENGEQCLERDVMVRSRDLTMEESVPTPVPYRLKTNEWLFQDETGMTIVGAKEAELVDDVMVQDTVSVSVEISGLKKRETITLWLRNAVNSVSHQVVLHDQTNAWKLSPGNYELILKEDASWLKWTVAGENVELKLNGDDAKIMALYREALDRLSDPLAILNGNIVMFSGDENEKAFFEALPELRTRYPDSYLADVILVQAEITDNAFIRPEKVGGVVLINEQGESVATLHPEDQLLLVPGEYCLGLVLHDGRCIAEQMLTVTADKQAVISADELALQWLRTSDIWCWRADDKNPADVKTTAMGKDADLLSDRGAEQIPVYAVTIKVPVVSEEKMYLLRNGASLELSGEVGVKGTIYACEVSPGTYLLSQSEDETGVLQEIMVKDQSIIVNVEFEKIKPNEPTSTPESETTQAPQETLTSNLEEKQTLLPEESPDPQAEEEDRNIKAYDSCCAVVTLGRNVTVPRVYGYNEAKKTIAQLDEDEIATYLDRMSKQMVSLTLDVRNFEESFLTVMGRQAKGTYWLLWYGNVEQTNDLPEQTMFMCRTRSAGIPLPAPSETGSIQLSLTPGNCQILFVEDEPESQMYLSSVMNALPSAKNNNRTYFLVMAENQVTEEEPLWCYHEVDELQPEASEQPEPTFDVNEFDFDTMEESKMTIEPEVTTETEATAEPEAALKPEKTPMHIRETEAVATDAMVTEAPETTNRTQHQVEYDEIPWVTRAPTQAPGPVQRITPGPRRTALPTEPAIPTL